MVAWLIEWPADRQMPVRYWHPTEGHVIDPQHAVRFCREEDAHAVLTRDKLFGGARPVEHVFDLTLRPFDWSEHEDDIADAISDSMDMDWTSRDGARAVVRYLQALSSQAGVG